MEKYMRLAATLSIAFMVFFAGMAHMAHASDADHWSKVVFYVA